MRKVELVQLRVSAVEKEAWLKAAAGEDSTLSEWARVVLNKAAAGVVTAGPAQEAAAPVAASSLATAAKAAVTEAGIGRVAVPAASFYTK